MKMPRRFFLLLLASVLTTACVTVTPDVTLPGNVGSQDGLLLIRFHADEAQGTLAVHQGAVSLPYAGFSIGGKDDLKLIRIRAGEGLRFSTFKTGGRIAHFDSQKLNFSVKPRTITYVGDVHVLQRPNTVYLRVVDNEEQTKALAMSRFPAMFSSFEYVKGLAGR